MFFLTKLKKKTLKKKLMIHFNAKFIKKIK